MILCLGSRMISTTAEAEATCSIITRLLNSDN